MADHVGVGDTVLLLQALDQPGRLGDLGLRGVLAGADDLDADGSAVHVPVARVPGGVALGDGLVDLLGMVVHEEVRTGALALASREVRRVVPGTRERAAVVLDDVVRWRGCGRGSCGPTRTAS